MHLAAGKPSNYAEQPRNRGDLVSVCTRPSSFCTLTLSVPSLKSTFSQPFKEKEDTKLCLFSLEQGQVPRHSAAHPHPKLRGVPPSPPPPTEGEGGWPGTYACTGVSRRGFEVQRGRCWDYCGLGALPAGQAVCRQANCVGRIKTHTPVGSDFVRGLQGWTRNAYPARQQVRDGMSIASERCPVVILPYNTPAVTLAFEEMRTPYASGREICVQKCGNAYQRKEIEKRMTHFKSTFTTEVLHHTVWRTWLFTAYSYERWFHYQFSLPHLYISLNILNLKRWWENVFFLALGVKKGLKEFYSQSY